MQLRTKALKTDQYLVIDSHLNPESSGYVSDLLHGIIEIGSLVAFEVHTPPPLALGRGQGVRPRLYILRYTFVIRAGILPYAIHRKTQKCKIEKQTRQRYHCTAGNALLFGHALKFTRESCGRLNAAGHMRSFN